MKPLFLLMITAVTLVGLLPAPARADYLVQVGYADNVRPSPFFPNPWEGSPQTALFAGAAPLAAHDSGAIEVVNTGATNITIDSLFVNVPSFFLNGAGVAIWGGFLPFTLLP